MNTTPITASNLRIRKSFSKNKQVIEIPNLIELQKSSYEAFLQRMSMQIDAEWKVLMAFSNLFSNS
jgi:DNA-directed RNA polymerase beta subunit